MKRHTINQLSINVHFYPSEQTNSILANVIFNSNKTNFNAMELKSESDDDDGLRFNGQIGTLLQ